MSCAKHPAGRSDKTNQAPFRCLPVFAVAASVPVSAAEGPVGSLAAESLRRKTRPGVRRPSVRPGMFAKLRDAARHDRPRWRRRRSAMRLEAGNVRRLAEHAFGRLESPATLVAPVAEPLGELGPDRKIRRPAREGVAGAEPSYAAPLVEPGRRRAVTPQGGGPGLAPNGRLGQRRPEGLVGRAVPRRAAPVRAPRGDRRAGVRDCRGRSWTGAGRGRFARAGPGDGPGPDRP